MLNSIFQKKFNFAYEYFSVLLELVLKNERNFPQALIFEGSDTQVQYLFALELARILNCTGDRTQNCNCTNCKWIRSNTHPAINMVSQIHFKPEDDGTATVISVKQAREIEKSLVLTSDYHRFFIFFSSCEKQYDPFELEDFQKLNYKSDIDFSIEPLNFKTFHPTTPNALLKSIEEPPERTTFIFLTRSREDILQTIVSRCQVIKLSGIKENLSYNEILPLFAKYPNIDYKDAFDISQNFQKLIKDTNQKTELVLNKILEYLKDILKQNIENADLVAKINNDISFVNQAIKHSRANVSDKNVFDVLFLRIARGY